ncbi:MAG: 50S ribosomal protein L35 [Desulfovibrionaceae bacterium CG1_02_65_16]|nr:MAG: 50S ribosomal protein L35 [Desulfovibrionaceae bacterium CG1_02_65_16]
MPKMKTNRSAAKRFVSNGAGKFKRRRQSLRHILTKKSPKRKRRLGQSTMIDDTCVRAVKRLLPYG